MGFRLRICSAAKGSTAGGGPWSVGSEVRSWFGALRQGLGPAQLEGVLEGRG